MFSRSPLRIIVINPSPKIDLTSLSRIHQNRNIPKENTSHRIPRFEAFNVLGVSIRQKSITSILRQLDSRSYLPKDGACESIARQVVSYRVVSCKFNLRNKIARPRCLEVRKRNGGVLTGFNRRRQKHYDCVTHPSCLLALDELHVTRMRKSESTSCVLSLSNLEIVFFFSFSLSLLPIKRRRSIQRFYFFYFFSNSKIRVLTKSLINVILSQKRKKRFFK